MLQIYYGNGKGKTTAAFGAALRIAGCGEKVAIAQFFKDGLSGECSFLKCAQMVSFYIPEDEYKLFEKTDTEAFSKRKQTFEKLLFEDIQNNLSDIKMLVLDEGLDVFCQGYFEADMFLDFLRKYKESIEIVLTGHSVTQEVIHLADYVSEIKEIKHPFKKGVSARRGIEF